MTTRKVENPNKKGNAAFIWAVLAVLAIALVVIGLIVFNGRENRSAAIREEMIDVTGVNFEWNEDEDIIHLTGSNPDANTAELFEDFSCSYCAELHIASDEAMLEKARMSMEAGATGLIFGRNVWQREHDESMRFVARLRDVLEKHPSG